MDDHLPKWLRYVLRKLDFLGLPNLSTLIIGLAILGFVGQNIMELPISQFVFDPYAVRSGEWWRLFAFPVDHNLSNPIFFIFYLLYIYFVIDGIQSKWGAGPLTVFTLLGYLCAIAGSILIERSVFIWFYVLSNISLAFGTLFPDMEFYIYFLIPIKAKWLTLFGAGLLAYMFFRGDMSTKIFLLVAHLPYFLFFGGFGFKKVRTAYVVYRNRRRLK